MIWNAPADRLAQALRAATRCGATWRPHDAEAGARQRQPVAFEADVAQGLDAGQRWVGSDGDAMQQAPSRSV